MGGSSRFDTLRVLLPGAVLITLVDLGARLIASMTVVRPSASGLVDAAQAFVDLVEDPFRGIVVAFGLGLILYFVNPAYATPQYWKDIPSEHVKQKADKDGLQNVDATGLYFLALNELMPTALRDRVLLYGQMYRIGFETVFYALLTVVATAVSALVIVGSSRSAFSLNQSAWIFLVLLVIELALFAFRLEVLRKEDLVRQAKSIAKWTFAVPVSLIVLLAFGGWVGLTVWPDKTGTVVIVLSATAAGAIWTLLRLKGRDWWPYIIFPIGRGTRPYRTTDAHSPFELLVLDAAFVTPWLFLMAGSSSALSVVHVGAPVALTMVALFLSHLRKYERQNHGVYRNQRLWIDLNWAEVRAKVDPK